MRAPTRQPVTCETTRHSGRLSGNTRAVYKVLDGSGVPSQYDRRRACVAIPLRHLDDVLARLDVSGVTVLMAVAT